MVAAGFTFPLILHLVLTHPTGRAAPRLRASWWPSSTPRRCWLPAALALFRDPYFDPGCLANCNVNIFLVCSLPTLARAVRIGDRWFNASVATGSH
jgi:hypothetical protein